MTNKQMAMLRCNIGRVLYEVGPYPKLLDNQKILIYRELTDDPEKGPLHIAQFSGVKEDNSDWETVFYGRLKECQPKN